MNEMKNMTAPAVAVPDERAAFEKWWREWGLGGIDVQWEAWQARAALAATPAAVAPDLHAQIMNLPLGTFGTGIGDIGIAYRAGHRAARHAAAELATFHATQLATFSAAAPVALPEPAYTLRVRGVFQDVTPAVNAFGLPDGEYKLFTEPQVLTKLATATGLPAQADMPDSFREWFAKNYPADTIIVDPDWHAKSIFRMALAHARLAAPQAQADARDALTLAELLELRRAADDFDEGCDTDVEHDLLARGAIAGYLFCERFVVLDGFALNAAIAAAKGE